MADTDTATDELKPWEVYAQAPSSQFPWEAYGGKTDQSVDAASPQDFISDLNSGDPMKTASAALGLAGIQTGMVNAGMDAAQAMPTPAPPPNIGATALAKVQGDLTEGAANYNLAQGMENVGARLLNDPLLAAKKLGFKIPQRTVTRYDAQGNPSIGQEDDLFQPGKSAYTPQGTLEQPGGNDYQKTVAGFLTPGNIAAFPFAAEKSVQAMFLAQTVPGAIEAAKKLVSKDTAPSDRAGAATDLLINAFMTHGLAHGLAKGGESYASSISTPAEVYGDLQSQPVSGQGEVPAKEGGAGVQPQTQGPVQAEVPLTQPDGIHPFDSGDRTQQFDYSPENLAKYKQMTADMKSLVKTAATDPAALDKMMSISGQLEELKNRYNGHTPKNLESPGTGTPDGGTKNAAGAEVRTQPQSGAHVQHDEETGEWHVVNGKGEIVSSHGTMDEAAKAAAPEAAKPQPFLEKGDQEKFDYEIKKTGVPIQYTDALDENNPFHPWKDTFIATIDRKTGSILINKENLKSWLDTLPISRRATAIRSMMAEEQIHLHTDDAAANTYWKNLSPWEQAIAKRRYGRGSIPEGMDDTMWGHEALRFRIQQLARLTPTEVASAVGKERWTLKGLSIAEHAIRGARAVLNFRNGRESRAILNKVQDNLKTARAILNGSSPRALFRGRPKKTAVPKEQQDFELPGMQSTRLAGSKIAASNVPGQEGADLPKATDEEKAAGEAKIASAVPQRPSSAELGKIGEKALSDDVAARLEQAKTGQNTRLPSLKDFTAELKKRWSNLKPGEVSDIWSGTVGKFLGNAKGEDLRLMGKAAFGGNAPEIKTDREIFEETDRERKGFVETAAAQDARLAREAKRKGGSIWNAPVPDAPPADGGPIHDFQRAEIKQHKLEQNLRNAIDGGDSESAARIRQGILDIKHHILHTLKEPYQAAVRAQKRRAWITSAIFRKMVKPDVADSEGILNRKSVTADDVRPSNDGKYSSYEDVSDFPQSKVAEALADKARRSNSDSATVTRRLAVLENKRTGEVSLVSAYDRPHGPEVPNDVYVIDPLSATRTHIPLEEAMGRYRVLRSVFLDQPVRKFKQDFKNIEEYTDKFGNQVDQDVRNAASYAPDSISPSEFAQEAGGRISEGSGGSFQGPHRDLVAEPEHGAAEVAERTPLTDPELRAVSAMMEEGGSPRNAQDVKRVLQEMTEKKPSPMVITALRKIATDVQKAHPDWDQDTLLSALAHDIYEKSIQSARTLKEGGKPSPADTGQDAGAASQATGESPGNQTYASQRGAAKPQDVTKPPEGTTVVRPVNQLTQDEWKAVTRQARLEARNKEAADRKETQLRNDKSEIRRLVEKGGPDDMVEAAKLIAKLRDQLDVQPRALFRRRLNEKKDETIEKLGVVKNQVKNLYKRQKTGKHMASTIDGLNTIGNNMGAQAEMSIRLESADNEKNALRFAKNFRGKKDILESAPAVLASGAVKTMYNYDPKALAEKARLLREDEHFASRAHSLKSMLGRSSTEEIKAAQQLLGTHLQNRLVETGFLKHDDARYLFDPKAKDKLDHFIAQVKLGDEAARVMAKRGSVWDRFRARRWLESNKKIMHTLEYAKAQWDHPELRNTAVRAKMEADHQFDIERDNGYSLHYDPEYLPGRYDGSVWSPNGIIFGGQRIRGRQFREGKTFKNIYEAAQVGPYIPASLDIASLMGSRVRTGMHSVSRKMWFDSLKDLKDENGNFVVKEGKPGGGPPEGYEEFPLKGTQQKIYVHESYVGLVHQLTDPDALMHNAATKLTLEATQFLKHTALMGDVFHLGRVTYYSQSIMGFKGARFKPGWAATVIREADLDRAVDRGIIAPRTRDYLKEKVAFRVGPKADMVSRSHISELYERAGLNTGRIQDALMKDLVKNFPGFGAYNRFLFDRFTTGMMKSGALAEFDRLSKLDPEKDSRQIIQESAKDLNLYFGSIGRQGWIKSATIRSIANIGLLAPQWLEGLIKKEAQPLKLLTSPHAALTGRTTAFRGMARGMAAMFALTQVINMITRGKPTWSNDEKDHKWDAWLPGDVWLSPLAVFNELTSDITRLMQTKPRAWDAIQQIGENKLSFAGRFALSLASGNSPTGEYQSTTGDVLKTAAKQLIPIPISFGTWAQFGAHFLAPGTVSPVPLPQLMQKSFATMGIKTHVGLDPVQTMNIASRAFKLANGVEEPKIQFTDEATNSKLRYQLKSGDENGAAKTLAQLRQHHTDGEIIQSMENWAHRPFTSQLHEGMFQAGMDDYGRKVYNQAIQQRYDQVNQFLEWYDKQTN